MPRDKMAMGGFRFKKILETTNTADGRLPSRKLEWLFWYAQTRDLTTPKQNISIQLFLETREATAACQPEHVTKLLPSRDLTIPRQNISIQLSLETRKNTTENEDHLPAWTRDQTTPSRDLTIPRQNISIQLFLETREATAACQPEHVTKLLSSRDLTTPRQNISIQFFHEYPAIHWDMHLFRMQHQRIFSREAKQIQIKLEIKFETSQQSIKTTMYKQK